jgi:hypothetical protein
MTIEINDVGYGHKGYRWMWKIVLFLLFISTIANAQHAKYKSHLLIPYRLQNTWGYCDTLGVVRITPRYDSAEFFNREHASSVAFVKKKAGIINDQGEVVLDFHYDKITNISPASYYAVFKGGKTGWFDADLKKFVIPVRYSSISYFHDDFYLIELHGKYGVIHSNGKVMIEPLYEKLSPYEFNTPKLIGTKSGKQYLIDLSTGKIENAKEVLAKMGYEEVEVQTDVEPYLDSVYNEMEKRFVREYGLDSVVRISVPTRYYARESIISRAYKNGKQGMLFVSPHGNVVYPTYEKITEVGEVVKEYQRYYLIAFKNGKAGIIDQLSDTILPFAYDNLFYLIWKMAA